MSFQAIADTRIQEHLDRQIDEGRLPVDFSAKKFTYLLNFKTLQLGETHNMRQVAST